MGPNASDRVLTCAVDRYGPILSPSSSGIGAVPESTRKGMYSGETPKRFSKHRRQLRDSIVQWSVYKRSLLINTELNVFV
jgi:hypothetical protein